MTNILETFSNGLGISLVVFLPLVSAIFILFIPKTQEFLIKITTLGASVAVSYTHLTLPTICSV